MRPFVNVSESDFRLLVCWMAAALGRRARIRSWASTENKGRPRVLWQESFDS